MRLICCFFTLFLFSQSYASQTYTTENFTVAEIPSWVVPAKPLRFDNIPHAQIRNGVHYLLVDNQVNVPVNSQPSYYTRYADLITNQSGLDQDSQINIGFDPAYQKVILHHVTVIRAGVAIDKLSSARVQILDQEDELENQIYNGEKTINILLEDMRVGDILDYSFTIVGDNPVFANVYSDYYRLQWAVPVANVRLRILWHKSGELKSKFLNSGLAFEKRELAGATEYSIDIKNMPVVNAEDGSPGWVNEFATVYLTETENWGNVIDWGIALFDRAIVADASIRDLARELSIGMQDDNDKIKRALQYVQTEIRYVGIELGINSHQAVPAARTLERRYGDCKDKTALLIALLEEMGITAKPALVHTRLRNQLLERLPSMRLFNHVIAAVEYNGKTVWLDATRQYQYGNVDEIYQPKYGQALVLSTSNNALESIPLKDDVTSSISVEHIDASSLDSNEVSYQIRSIYSGLRAERMHSYLENDGIELIRKDYLDFYRKYYSEIEGIDGPVFNLDTDYGLVYVDESYRISDFWDSSDESNRETGWVYGSGLTSYLKEPESEERTQDFKIAYPVNVTQQLSIKLSNREWSFENELFEEENSFFKYSRDLKYDSANKLLQIDFSYKSKLDHVPANQFPQYKTALMKAKNKNEFGFYRRTKEALEPPSSTPLDAILDYAFEIVIGLYLILWGLFFILWRIHSKRNPEPESMVFYPVSTSKFITMWVVSFGIYGLFWFFRNWRYVKFHLGETRVSPFWRAFFMQFWYYPMYQRIGNKSGEDDSAGSGVSRNQAIFLAVLFLIAITAAISESTIGYIALLICPCIVLPLLSMVNRLNLDASGAYEYNSHWYPRHGLMMILVVPVFVLAVGGDIGLLPSDKVIRGEKIWSRNIQFMQRRGILDPGDEVHFFYSDAFIDIKKDGNGFTDHHVFSYWVTEDGEFLYESIRYNEISKIEVIWAKDFLDNTVVEIHREAGDKTLLFVSNTDAGDKEFVRELKKQWNKNK